MSVDFPTVSGSTSLAKGKAGPVFAGQLSVENVSYGAGGKTIVDNVNLTVPPGKIACLLGPSGCGKTTLLRLIAGILRPVAGRILMDSFELSGPDIFVPPEKRNIGMVFQDFALFPHMSVVENVAYGLTALSRRDARHVASLILERVGLGASKDRMPSSLSGGEQQRVALARALVPRPQVVLLDEPFSGLDQRLKDSVRDETLALLKETRATAILVTHDPTEALAFGDQIHVMQHGQIAQSGTPEELVRQPKDQSIASFFRAYNQFRGVVQQGKIQTPLGQLAAQQFTDGTLVDVLVAPSGIAVLTSGKGVAATVLENRDLGDTRRLIARLHVNDQALHIHGSFNSIGEVSLVLTGADTHIFKAG
jgi:iron(III) transport system ATP-binding protein